MDDDVQCYTKSDIAKIAGTISSCAVTDEEKARRLVKRIKKMYPDVVRCPLTTIKKDEVGFVIPPPPPPPRSPKKSLPKVARPGSAMLQQGATRLRKIQVCEAGQELSGGVCIAVKKPAAKDVQSLLSQGNLIEKAIATRRTSIDRDDEDDEEW